MFFLWHEILRGALFKGDASKIKSKLLELQRKELAYFEYQEAARLPKMNHIETVEVLSRSWNSQTRWL